MLTCSPAIRLQRPIRLLPDVQNRFLLAERWCFPWFIASPQLPPSGRITDAAFAPPDEPVPGYDRLWDMLIKRCPHLESLAIDGHSPHAPVDAHGLVHGRWPHLRTLLLGDVVFDWHLGQLSPERPFRVFLNAHRNLEELHLQSHAPSVAAPGVLADLHADALAKVGTFSGALVQAQALPARGSLKVLRVPDPMPLREGTPLSVGASLAALPSLCSLTLAFRLEQGYDNGSILRAVVAACPHLRHLDITIACRPSITVVRRYPINAHATRIC
jgi:hypothetical protein